MEEAKNTEEVRKAVHTINPEDDLNIKAHTTDGRVIYMDAFRAVKEHTRVIGQLSFTGGETGEFAGEETLMPEKLEVAQPNRFDFVRRHKGTLITIGSVVLTIATSTGILIRRHHKSK